jgi:hypothetical protein
MLRRILGWLRPKAVPPPHRHDYMMEFDDPAAPFCYTLRCSCGDVASSQQEALSKMGLRP